MADRPAESAHRARDRQPRLALALRPGACPVGRQLRQARRAPSHPELLDWLAIRFVEDGWSLKALHRRIMLSQTYRMSTAWNERAAQVDPEDRLLWRMPRRRMEAEELRDAILAVERAARLHDGRDAARLVALSGSVRDGRRSQSGALPVGPAERLSAGASQRPLRRLPGVRLPRSRPSPTAIAPPRRSPRRRSS